MERGNHLAGSAGRLFAGQPERLAAAWRRERFGTRGESLVPENLLDGVVEDFIRQVGLSLDGAPHRPWARTRGVLRLSVTRGARGLQEEFGALRRCLLDALEVSGGTADQVEEVNLAVDEAFESALGLHRRLLDPRAPGPRHPFGGLVVEIVEARARPAAAEVRP
jgi:hypothetical protein